MLKLTRHRRCAFTIEREERRQEEDPSPLLVAGQAFGSENTHHRSDPVFHDDSSKRDGDRRPYTALFIEQNKRIYFLYELREHTLYTEVHYRPRRKLEL